MSSLLSQKRAFDASTVVILGKVIGENEGRLFRQVALDGVGLIFSAGRYTFIRREQWTTGQESLWSALLALVRTLTI
jgi:hypothetical protein